MLHLQPTIFISIILHFASLLPSNHFEDFDHDFIFFDQIKNQADDKNHYLCKLLDGSWAFDANFEFDNDHNNNEHFPIDKQDNQLDYIDQIPTDKQSNNQIINNDHLLALHNYQIDDTDQIFTGQVSDNQSTNIFLSNNQPNSQIYKNDDELSNYQHQYNQLDDIPFAYNHIMTDQAYTQITENDHRRGG